MTTIPFGFTFLRVKASAIYNVCGENLECKVQLWIGPFRNIAEKDAWREAYRTALRPLGIFCNEIKEQVVSPKIVSEIVPDICSKVGPILASLDTKAFLGDEYRELRSSRM